MHATSKVLHDYMLALGEGTPDVGEKYQLLLNLTQQDYGQDIKLWVSWFLNKEDVSEEEKEYIKAANRLYQTRNKFKSLGKE